MKLKRISIVVSLILSVCMLSGCMGLHAGININEDGSGTFAAFSGFTKETLISFSVGEGETMTDEEFAALIEEDEYVTKEIDGVMYYGEYEEVEFANLEELNTYLNTNEDGTISEIYVLDMDDNGDFTFTINAMEDMSGSNAELEGLDLTEEELEELLSTMKFVFEVSFPKNIYQVSGDVNGITIDGKVLILDLMEMDANYVDGAVYKFSTIPTVVEEKPESVFNDVPTAFWGYKAIEDLHKHGIINGVGNNNFAPNENMTYAQFCQIMYNMFDGTIIYENSTYWAANAIRYCIINGAVEDMGAISPELYNVPISREAAVGGFMKLVVAEFDNSNVSSEIIPDFDKIDSKYQDYIFLSL